MRQPAVDPFSSATSMLDALRRRDVSAVELLDVHLDRIARHNSTLNAIVIPDYDSARRRAELADEQRARGEDAALLGLPLTIKDCIDVAGLRGTAGVPEFAERVPERDSPLARRVRAAGAVLLGKTNVPPMAGDWTADNPIFGRTLNPWDLSRTPGGSTGGGAAALAAGLTPLEFGSDIGGSIRVPAAFCGLYGHRPSETAVPRSGHFPGGPLQPPAFVLGVQGPLARDAGDLELALDVIAGPDQGEDVAWDVHIPPARHERLSDFRVAILPLLDWVPVDNEIFAAQERVAATLRDAGAQVATIQPEALGDQRDYFAVYRSLLAVMISQGMPREERQRIAAECRATGDPGEIAWAAGLEADAFDLMHWFNQREIYRADWRAFFRAWDVVLAPVYLTAAFPHPEGPLEERRHVVNGAEVRYVLPIVYAGLSTLPGLPSTAFPAGLSSAGLPIGLQAVGPYLDDRTPIRFAELLAREIGGFQPPPGYDS